MPTPEFDPGPRLSELGRLEGRVALVTGGAGHIGYQAAAALAEQGARVAIADLAQAEEAAQAVAAIFDVECDGFRIDLEDEAEVRALPARVDASLGGCDIIVTSAALVGSSGLEGWAVPFREQRSSTWRRALEVNLTSVFSLVQSAVPLLARSGHGAVVNMGSIYGVVGPQPSLYAETPLGNPAGYAASKGGLIQLTRWLSTSLAPSVRVNSISPGGIARGQNRRFLQRYTDRTPMGRLGREADLKGAVAYLCSDLSAYVTGVNLLVDGGWTAW